MTKRSVNDKFDVSALSEVTEAATPCATVAINAPPPRTRLTISRPRPRIRWSLAAVAAVFMHLGLLAAMMVVPTAPVADDGLPPPLVVTLIIEPEAAPATDMPPVQTLPAVEPPPLPPEPPLPDSQPPPDHPSPSVPSLEAEPMPRQNPVETLPLPPPPEQPHRVARAPVARTPPLLAKPPATAPAEPPRAPGQAAATDLLGPYRNSLAAHLKAYQRYPALARSRREEGLVVVRITIKRDGEILDASIEHGSGWEALDHEALAALKRADPLPAVPTGVPGPTMELEFPVRFSLQ